MLRRVIAQYSDFPTAAHVQHASSAQLSANYTSNPTDRINSIALLFFTIPSRKM